MSADTIPTTPPQSSASPFAGLCTIGTTVPIQALLHLCASVQDGSESVYLAQLEQRQARRMAQLCGEVARLIQAGITSKQLVEIMTWGQTNAVKVEKLAQVTERRLLLEIERGMLRRREKDLEVDVSETCEVTRPPSPPFRVSTNKQGQPA